MPKDRGDNPKRIAVNIDYAIAHISEQITYICMTNGRQKIAVDFYREGRAVRTESFIRIKDMTLNQIDRLIKIMK